MNTFIAAAHLVRVQLFARMKKYIVLLAFAAPAVIAWFAANRGQNLYAFEAYSTIITLVFASVLVPFIALFWGSALLSDEIEGKTLVYIWTRPANRAVLFASKYVVTLLCLAVLLLISVSICFFFLYGREGIEQVRRNIMVVGWDSIALVLGGAAYAALGLFLASIFKKPFVVGVLYLLAWDNAVQFIPGFLKRFSIRHYIYTLGSNPGAEQPRPFFKFLTQSTTTDAEAWITLIAASILLLAIAVFLVTQKEFLGDDPARVK